MKKACRMVGMIAGIAGTVVCLVAVGGRFYGQPEVFGWAASHFLLLGAAILVFACWAKLEGAQS